MSRRLKRNMATLQWEEEQLDACVVRGVRDESDSPSSTGNEGNVSQNIEQLTRLVCALTANISATNTQKTATMGNDAIPLFDPTDKATNITRWLAKVEELKNIYGWNDVSTAYFATRKLTNYAKTWYDRLPSINFTWEEWKERLIAAFPAETDFSEMLDTMMKRRKSNGESIIQYYYEKLALLNTCEIYGRKAVSCIISGIPDNHVKMTAKAGNYENPENLLKYLKTIESDTRETTYKIVKPMSKKPLDSRVNLDFKRTRHEWEDERRKCYGCGSRNHLISECKIKRNCERCRTNHSGMCKGSSQFTKQTRKEALAIKGDKSSSKKFFMDVHINNIKVEAFIDLGSECNILKKSIVEFLNLSCRNENIAIRGFGGGLIHSLGTVKDVMVRIDKAEACTDFVIVPDETLNITAIIGQPFTESDGVVVYKDSESLRIFSNNNFSELPAVFDLPRRKVPFWAKYVTVLPPKHTVNIICKTETEGCFYFNSSARIKENNEHLVLRCVVNVNSNKECILPVINPTNKEVTIKPNKIFARGEICNSEESKQGKDLHKSFKNDTLSDLHIGSTLSANEKDKLISLLNTYRHCFASSLEQLGCTTAAELKIDMLDDKPVTYKPYRMNPSSKQKVKEIVDELLKYEIIRESSSPFASPVLLVKKKNGEQRLCIDYRKLNEKIKQDKFPLPRIDDQLDELQGYHYFTTLDMTSGYYQIPVEEASRDKTSFVTPDGQYEFNRMPFGISTAPSVFQRMMNKILGPLRGTEATVYLDDIIIPSKDFNGGIKRLTNILDIFTEHHLTLNPKKCNFFETSIMYLGFEVSSNGIKPGLKKVECVKQFPTPRNVHQVRQFLGLTSFFRQFIKNYALLARPLTNLLKKDQKWIWTKLEQDSFESLKNRLIERPILAIYNPMADTEVHTDASKHGLAGILLQKDAESKLHPVAFYSRRTTPAEEKYHSYELETLAVVETVKKFRVYLLDIKFKVITDCSAIKAAAKKRDLIPRIARWWLTLQEFTFDIEHRPGIKMAHIDCLSRNPVDKSEDDAKEYEILRIEIGDWVLAGQLTDEKVKNIHDILKTKPTTDYEKSIHKDYSLENERIYKVTERGLKWLVPKGMRNEIVRGAHDEFGHFALEKTLKKICENYWFPNMKDYVQRYINSCIRCLYHKQPAGKQVGLLNPIEKVNIPFHTIHMDHLGPFVRSSSGKKFLIVCVEAFTKFTMLQAVKDTKTQAVLRFLEEIINQFGVPQRIITDKGTSYTSKAFGKFCRQKGVKHVQNAVSTPRANGQVERFNSTILASLATTAQVDTKWDKELNKVQFAINNSVHSITKKTPCELLYGYRPRAPADSVLTSEVSLQPNLRENINEEREKAAERIRNSQQKQKERFDKKRKIIKRDFKVGELVLVRKRSAAEGQSKKLLPKYKGPFRITRKLPHDRFVLKELPGSTRSLRAPYENVEAIDHLKRWIPVGAKSDTEEEECVEIGKRARGRSPCQDDRAVTRDEMSQEDR